MTDNTPMQQFEQGLKTIHQALLRTAILSTLLLLPVSVSAAADIKSELRPTDYAPADNSSSTSPPLHEIIVQSQKILLQRRLSSFVSRITKSKSLEESLARWHEPICPLALGLPKDQGDFVIKRLLTIAQAIGAATAGKDCSPNLIILVTPEPVPVLQLWNASNTGPFAGGWPSAINEFLNGQRLARTWYNVDHRDEVNNPRRVDGVPLRSKGSRIVLNEVLAITSAVVVVDTSRAIGYKLGAMADYITMVGLVEINVDADLEGDAPTILRLFDAAVDQRPQGLSNWDKAFLKGVYNTPQNSRMQRSEIVKSMVREVAP